MADHARLKLEVFVIQWKKSAFQHAGSRAQGSRGNESLSRYIRKI